jgi:hypothetical protein
MDFDEDLALGFCRIKNKIVFVMSCDSRTQRRLKRQRVRDHEEQTYQKRKIEYERQQEEQKKRIEKEQEKAIERKVASWQHDLDTTRMLANHESPRLIQELMLALPFIPLPLVSLVDAYATLRYLLVGGSHEKRISFMDDYEHASFAEFTIDPQWVGCFACTLTLEQNRFVTGFSGRNHEPGDLNATFQIDVLHRKLTVLNDDWKFHSLQIFSPERYQESFMWRPIVAQRVVVDTNVNANTDQEKWLIMDQKRLAWISPDHPKLNLILYHLPLDVPPWVNNDVRAGIVYHDGAYYSLGWRNHTVWRHILLPKPHTTSYAMNDIMGASPEASLVARIFLWANEIWVVVFSRFDYKHYLVNVSEFITTGSSNPCMLNLFDEPLKHAYYRALFDDMHGRIYGLVWIDSFTHTLYFHRGSDSGFLWPIYAVNKNCQPDVGELFAVHEVTDSTVLTRAIRFQGAISDIPLNAVSVPSHLWFPALKNTK